MNLKQFHCEIEYRFVDHISLSVRHYQFHGIDGVWMWLLLDWSSCSVPDLSWDPAIVNTGDVTAADGKCAFSALKIKVVQKFL